MISQEVKVPLIASGGMGELEDVNQIAKIRGRCHSNG